MQITMFTKKLEYVLLIAFTTVLLQPIARLGYVDPINGVSQQGATRPVARWQQRHQPHLSICMPPSVQ